MSRFNIKLIITMIVMLECKSIVGCSCRPIGIKDYLAQNDTLPMNKKVVIIKGVVIGAVGSNVFNKFGQSNLVNLKVLEYWPTEGLKYLEGNTITLFNDGDDCSVPFVKDSTYLVRAYTFDRYLGTTLCTGTELLSHSLDDIEILGRGNVVKGIVALNTDTNSSKSYWVKDNVKSILVLVTIISLLLNIILYLKIKDRGKPT